MMPTRTLETRVDFLLSRAKYLPGIVVDVLQDVKVHLATRAKAVPVPERFVDLFAQIAQQAHDNSKAHGFWDQEGEVRECIVELDKARHQSPLAGKAAALLTKYAATRNVAEQIALMHSELSEGLEAVRRNPNQPSEHIPDFTALEEEYADVIIRIMDNAAGSGLDVGAAIIAKMRFNAGRPIKHGKQF